MGRTATLIATLLFSVPALAQQGAIDATTATGEKVKLLSDGRWEYIDPAKAAPQRKAREAEAQAAEAAAARDRNAQGGWFGIGRRVPEGDKDYNRGSLNPARR